jgi:hypothetical protein
MYERLCSNASHISRDEVYDMTWKRASSIKEALIVAMIK